VRAKPRRPWYKTAFTLAVGKAQGMSESTAREGPWVPPTTLEERIKNTLVPAPVYWRIRAYRSLIKGEPELRLLRYLVDPAKTSVDAGANKGVYTYFLSKLSRRVYAYEPNPKIFEVLKRSVSRANVTLSRAALSDRSGEDTLLVPRGRTSYSNQLASLRKDKFTGPVREVAVETRRLDDEDVGPVGFIKIDVEGFERNVIRGGEATIRTFRPVLLVEIEEAHTGEPIEETLDLVRGFGYGGLFLSNGALRALESFDAARDHRQAAPETYVYNFVFLPD
jgi:FkbM family methyltransferase